MSNVGLTSVGPVKGKHVGHVLVVVALSLAACSGTELTNGPTTQTAPSTTQALGESTPPTSDVTATSAPAQESASMSLDWVEASISGEALLDQVLVTDDGYLAYVHDHQAWTSVDGIEWTEKELVVEDEVFFATDVIATATSYVALGSTFDEDTVLLTSPDGLSWTSHLIELEQPQVSDFGVESVHATPSGDLILTGSFLVDDADGHHHETLIWASADSESWDLVSVPFQQEEGFVQILSTGDALVAYADPGRLWASSDGAVWEELTIQGLDTGFLAHPGLVLWGDTLVVAVFDPEGGLRFLSSTDGREWSRLPTHELLENSDELAVQPGFGSIAAGPYGIALLGTLQPVLPPEPDVIIERDGLRLTVHLETLTFTLTNVASTEVLSEGSLFENPNVGIPEDGDTVTFFDPDTGEELIAVTGEEFDQARQEAYEAAGLPSPREQDFVEISTLWFSPDGERWASIPTEEITGTENFIEQIIVGQESILLRIPQIPDFGDEEFGQEEFGEVEEEEFEFEEFEIIWVVTFAEGQ